MPGVVWVPSYEMPVPNEYVIMPRGCVTPVPLMKALFSFRENLLPTFSASHCSWFLEESSRSCCVENGKASIS